MENYNLLMLFSLSCGSVSLFTGGYIALRTALSCTKCLIYVSCTKSCSLNVRLEYCCATRMNHCQEKHKLQDHILKVKLIWLLASSYVCDRYSAWEEQGFLSANKLKLLTFCASPYTRSIFASVSWYFTPRTWLFSLKWINYSVVQFDRFTEWIVSNNTRFLVKSTV